MAHTSITLDDHSPYFEGDAIDIELTVTDSAGDPLDLAGTTLEFIVKRAAIDPDDEAVLTKTTADPAEIEVTDSLNGEATIYIQTDDTDGALTDPRSGRRADAREFFWALRVTDPDTNRVTAASGTWEINAS